MNTRRKALLIAGACSLAAGVSTVAAALVTAQRVARAKHFADTRLPAPAPSPSASVLGTGPDGLPGRLAGLIAIPTVMRDLPVTGTGPFRAAQRYLEQQYPRVHTYLERTINDEIGMEFFWPSATTLEQRALRAANLADTSAHDDDSAAESTTTATAQEHPAQQPDGAPFSEQPIVIMMHIDVMSADSLGWQYPPFSGAIADGKVHGRGSFASKGPLICLFDAIEQLLATEWTPQRDIYVLVSSDTEDDAKMSRSLVHSLCDRGIRPEIVLDVGGAITQFPVGFHFASNFAGIGVAQNGNAVYQLSASAAGGATATPHGQSDHAIAVLSKQVHRAIRRARFTNVDHNMRVTYKLMWQHAEGMSKSLTAVAALLPKLTSRVIAAIYKDAAPLFKTSLVTTNFRAGNGEQVVPTVAIAKLQAHLAPGDSIPQLTKRIRHAINDPRVRLDVLEQREGITFGFKSDAYRSIANTVSEVFDDVLPVPFTTYYFTDSRFFRDTADNIFCFAPLVISPEQRSAIHSTNESVDIAALHQAVKFYRTWLHRIADTPLSTGAL